MKGNCSNAYDQKRASGVTVTGRHKNSSHRWLEPRMLDFVLLFGGSHFEFSMNFQLNDRRRKINPSAFLVRSLEAVQCEFLGENWLGAGPG